MGRLIKEALYRPEECSVRDAWAEAAKRAEIVDPGGVRSHRLLMEMMANQQTKEDSKLCHNPP